MSLRHHILDTIFPRRCLGCGTYDTWLCQACQQRHRDVELLTVPAAAPGTLASITTLGRYADPVWRQAIQLLKFDGMTEVADCLGDLLAAVLLSHPQLRLTPPKNMLLLPVPLHRLRHRQRGYNQAALLAQRIAHHTGWRVAEDIITRHKATHPQSNLTDSARRDNITAAFRLHPTASASAAHKTIILLDDVITTGATIEQCAQLLGQLQPARIHVAAVARGR